MTVLATADIRSFYAALGVELPRWSTQEAPVRCFASPDAHAHKDRRPSTSVSLASGAWCCHGCGAAGGAYDAALAVGLAPREAVELMIRHGLIEPRPRSARSANRTATRTTATRVARVEPARLADRRVAATDADVRHWHASLSHRPALLERLAIERAWRFGALCQLEVGLDGNGRITIPIRNGDHELRGVLRYHPWPTNSPKMLAIRGTRLGLIPHPGREASTDVVLVEGPADMLAARSTGINAIAVPGANAWRARWSALLAGQNVTIVMDCDDAGRKAAERIATDLRSHCRVKVVDLDPSREDGYDVTDALQDRAHRRHGVPALDQLVGGRSITRGPEPRGLER